MEGETQIHRRDAPAPALVKRAAGLGYVPGGPAKRPCVTGKDKPMRTNQSNDNKLVTAKKKHKAVPDLPSECIHHIALHLVKAKQDHAVIIMSMVNKQYWQTVGNDAQLWYEMYTHWRGPLAPAAAKPSLTGRGWVRLMPSIPRSLPNFRDLGLSIA